MLVVIAKYKKSQLKFFDELRVFDPRQRDSMPHDLQSYPNLLSPELQKLLHTSCEWRLHWKVYTLEFDILQWWESAGAFMGLPNLANEALNAPTF